MNAHSLRTILRRRNLIPFTFYFLLIVVAVFGLTAGVVQSSTTVSSGSGHGTQKPPFTPSEDIAKEFNDDDLKVKEQKPRGKWGAALESDMDQFHDTSVPVAIGAIQSLSGGGKYAGVTKIKRVEIKNRSSKVVNSVQLRWEIVSLDNPAKVLSEGATPFINTWAEANSSLVIEIPTLYPAHMLKPLAKDGDLNGRFSITIGVQEVRFADGSFWRREESVGWLNLLYFGWPPINRFPSIASIIRRVPLPADPNNGRVVITPCEAKPRSPASAFSSMPFQNTTCHDNTTTWVDDNGKQSCGFPSPGQACYQTCSPEGFCEVWREPGGTCSDSTPTPTPDSPPPNTTNCT